MLLGFRSRCTTCGEGRMEEDVLHDGSEYPVSLLVRVGGEALPHPLAVEVVYSLCDGVEHSAGLSFREKLLPEDSIQQLPSLHQLRHQIHISALVVHLQQPHTRQVERSFCENWWKARR